MFVWKLHNINKGRYCLVWGIKFLPQQKEMLTPYTTAIIGTTLFIMK